MKTYLAVDIGASSGRIILGTIKDGILTCKEIHRFVNQMIKEGGHDRWDIDGLFHAIHEGLKANATDLGDASSIAIDTWGVDFVLLDENGERLENPVAYRDSRTDGMMDAVFERVSKDEIYARTGIPSLQFNTIYQLYYLSQNQPELLEKAHRILMIPDYLTYRLSGEMAMEYSNATTTQLLNAQNEDWDTSLLNAIGVPPAIFTTPVTPGTRTGTLSPAIQQSTGMGELPVIRSTSHDTASAVVAVPAKGDDWAFISSGTWSLVGVELDEPITTPAAMDAGFSNEGGYGGTIRFLKNIMGLWLVQCLKKSFEDPYSYEELTELAEAAPAFQCPINANDSRFLNPPCMKEAIDAYCREHGQAPPDSVGAYIRCAYEGLAAEYKEAIDTVQTVTGRTIKAINVVGGGSQNYILCQMTADVTGLPVYAGPVEGTAIGNIIVQAIAMGDIASLDEGRSIIANSVELITYEPKDTAAWSTYLDALK